MIRKILVPARGDGKGDNVFAHATALARRFHAHVEVVHCRPRPEDLLPFGVPIPAMLRDQLLKSTSSVADAEEAVLRKEMTALCENFHLEMTDGPSDVSASASFIERAGRQVDVIRRYGRLSDIIAVAQPDRDRNLGANTLKSALFHTGRSVLMCPETDGTPPDTLGQNVAIAWNGSLEGTRAVAISSDLIRQAENVTILCEADKPNSASAAELQDYLTSHDVAATINRIDGNGSVAKRLLAAGSDLGALLLMGAYGDSHERETVFGGNTQHVVDHAENPVMLVH
jgi:nucleotide-binding universal stress UspA family protein